MHGEKVNSISGQTDSVACGWCGWRVLVCGWRVSLVHYLQYTGQKTKFETGMRPLLAYHTDMAAALRGFFTRRGRPVTEPVTRTRCPCTNPDKEQFPAVARDGDTLRGEFELPTAGDIEWLLFS